MEMVLMQARLADSMVRILSARESSKDWMPKRTSCRSGDGERDSLWIEWEQVEDIVEDIELCEQV